MKLEHTALTYRSAQEADNFFSGLLGLEKLREFTIPRDLAGEMPAKLAELEMLFTNWKNETNAD